MVVLHPRLMQTATMALAAPSRILKTTVRGDSAIKSDAASSRFFSNTRSRRPEFPCLV
jgi:hypothetical protein